VMVPDFDSSGRPKKVGFVEVNFGWWRRRRASSPPA
jgi:hypothetical protein